MTKKTGTWIIFLILATAAAAFVSLGIGYRDGALTWNPLWPSILFGNNIHTSARDIMLSIRLPRLVAALVVGASLASAGLVLQSVSRNPLADPFLLGISGGAALFVVLVHGISGLSQSLGWWVVPVAAFIGAQAATLIVLTIARGPGGRITVLGIILGGIIINAFCAALTLFLMIRFDPHRLRITTLWLAGGLSSETWPRLALASLLALFSFMYLRMKAHRLNAFAVGEEGAAGLGVDTDRELRRVTIASSILAGVAVSLSGLLGYVGLVVPHLARMITGSDLKTGLPAAALTGALLLVLADAGSRVIAAPQELPVGVIAALAGCPVLLVLLRREIRK